MKNERQWHVLLTVYLSAAMATGSTLLVGCASKAPESGGAAGADAGSSDPTSPVVDGGPAPDASADARANASKSDASASHATNNCAPSSDKSIASYPPPVVKPGACVDSQLDSFWQYCIEMSSEGPTWCDEWATNSANKDCASCLMTYADSEPTAVYGYIGIGDGAEHVLQMNVPGCMLALASTDTEKACATADAERALCHANACQKQCADVASLSKCYDASDSAICRARNEMADAACSDWNKPGSLFDRCWASDEHSRFFKVAHVLCGRQTADAGSGG